jgi:hypothetical protein
MNGELQIMDGVTNDEDDKNHLEAIMDITDSEICHIFEEMQESCLSLDT